MATDNNELDEDFKELLKEFHASKDKEKALEKAKEALPPMIRQKSAPLWDHMLNPRKDGSVDPLNLANRLENDEISYDKAVEEARKYYEKEQESSNKKKGGRKKRKSRRKRHKKGGYASNYQPSEAELAAHRYGIPTHRYRQYVRDWNNYGWRNSDAAGDGVSGPRTDEHNLNQFILRRIAQDREQEEREREIRRLAAIRARAYRVANLLPENVEPQYATLREVQDAEQIQENQRRRRAEIARAAAEAARLKADEETRSVYVPVENPDGSIQMGRAVLPTIEEAQRLRNEMAEIPVTRPSRLRRMKEIARRVKQFLVERSRAIRNRTFFRTRRNRRRNNAIVPMGGPLDPIGGGRRKTRKRKNKRKRTRKVKRRRKKRRKKSKKVRQK